MSAQGGVEGLHEAARKQHAEAASAPAVGSGGGGGGGAGEEPSPRREARSPAYMMTQQALSFCLRASSCDWRMASAPASAEGIMVWPCACACGGGWPWGG